MPHSDTQLCVLEASFSKVVFRSDDSSADWDPAASQAALRCKTLLQTLQNFSALWTRLKDMVSFHVMIYGQLTQATIAHLVKFSHY